MTLGGPAYLALHASGELAERARRTQVLLHRCVTCPRNCRVDRTAGELGVCRIGALAQVASYAPHFGEEAALVGRGGSGTIFFAGCNLGCVFCQNYDISQPTRHHAEWEAGPERIAEMMLSLQAAGCENINFVSPSHVVPQILAALALAVDGGLRLPLVYNSGGYDAVHTLRLLDGVIDIYMPDMKYSDDRVGQPLSGVGDYVARNRATVLEMHRQVGDLELDERGVARRGLLVRHLVLPDGLAGTADVARFLVDDVSRDTYINVMDQYRPAYNAALGDDAAQESTGEAALSCRGILRPPTVAECRVAVEEVAAAGLWRLDGRDLAGGAPGGAPERGRECGS